MSQCTKENSLLIIGISGVTCGGKTTAANNLKDVLPIVKIFSQDDYFLNEDDSRHLWIPELNHVNFDIITSLDMEKMYKDILHFIDINKFKRVNHMNKINCQINSNQYTGDISQIVSCKIRELNMNVLIIEGFSIFNYKPMVNLFDLKYYFTLDRGECFKRRIKRIYEPPDCPGYFERCAWPEYLKQLDDVKKTVNDVKYLDGNGKNSLDKILRNIFQYFQK